MYYNFNYIFSTRILSFIRPFPILLRYADSLILIFHLELHFRSGDYCSRKLYETLTEGIRYLLL